MKNQITPRTVERFPDPARAFERFRVWLEEREFPSCDRHLSRFTFMGVSANGRHYQFKNINTRNYIYVNINPRPFNL